MIQTLVLDVDGVINGSLEGINTPFPSNTVVKALQAFKGNGGTIIFCTSKGIYPIVEIVERYSLGGIHIADAGGIIYDSTTKHYQINGIEYKEAEEIFNTLLQTNNYFEMYTQDTWYIPSQVTSKYSSIHSDLLRKQPEKIISFAQIPNTAVSKFLYFIDAPVESHENSELVQTLSKYSTKWTVSPVLQPANLLVVTKQGVSKQSALLQIAKEYSIDLSNALGVGDHHSDWKFMSLCGYKGVMGNSTKELFEFAEADDQSNVAYGKTVDEDGLIDIMSSFR